MSFNVSDIVSHRVKNGAREFLVKWADTYETLTENDVAYVGNPTGEIQPDHKYAHLILNIGRKKKNTKVSENN